MPGVSQIVFVAQHLHPNQVTGRRVLDVGSADFNGSIKPIIMSYKPSEYVGIDIINGKNVDRILPAHHIVAEFGERSFDIILCLEMLEHATLWKESLVNLKRALKPGGLLFLTTRSFGFPLHGFPHDYWRFTTDDLAAACRDLTLRSVERDPGDPGVLLYAEKPDPYVEQDITPLSVHCMMTGQLEESLPPRVEDHSYYRRLLLRNRVKEYYAATTRRLSALANKVFALK
jgi:SAM-dependent methyltransferase